MPIKILIADDHAVVAAGLKHLIEAPPELGYAIYFGVSANTWRFWDIEQPREEIGYDPQDDAERWR